MASALVSLRKKIRSWKLRRGSTVVGNQRGMALIFVLSLVGVIIAVMGEVFFQAQITVRSSVG